MPFKRSSSDISSSTPPTSPVQPTTPSPDRNSVVKQELTPVTKKRKDQQTKKDDTTPSSKKSRPATNTGVNGDWTPEKRELIMDKIIANGYKATNLSELATEFGLSKQQVVNQFSPGRKGSLREKAVKAVA